MKITSAYSREWPSLGFSIQAGEEKEGPKDAAALKEILATDGVSEVGKKPVPAPKED